MPAVGLDLGTSNAVAACLAEGRPTPVALRGGAQSIPAAVAVDERGRWLVGREARAQLISRPADTVIGMKSLLGRAPDSTAFRMHAEALSYEIVSDNGTVCARVGGHDLPLVEAASMVLRELRGQAQDNLGHEITSAVLPVPDYFTEEQRDALLAAAAQAGIDTPRVVDQTEALTRVVELAGRGRDTRVIFLYGLGGGVFEATVLERTSTGRYEVLATTGEDLGGTLFDRRIARHLHRAFAEGSGLRQFADPVGLQRILEASEAAKIRLDDEEDVEVHIPYLATCEGGAPLDLKHRLTRAILVELTGELIQKTMSVSQSALRAARIEPHEVDAVFLYGRATRAREIHAATARFFHHAPVLLPISACALGAAIVAGT